VWRRSVPTTENATCFLIKVRLPVCFQLPVPTVDLVDLVRRLVEMFHHQNLMFIAVPLRVQKRVPVW
jgi:hypothetical protein